jgi:hypothetical protein
MDGDHVMEDLRDRFDEVLEALKLATRWTIAFGGPTDLGGDPDRNSSAPPDATAGDAAALRALL